MHQKELLWSASNRQGFSSICLRLLAVLTVCFSCGTGAPEAALFSERHLRTHVHLHARIHGRFKRDVSHKAPQPSAHMTGDRSDRKKQAVALNLHI
eukprot:jgi/Botrbrau1/14934/Bobra.0018s0038.1